MCRRTRRDKTRVGTLAHWYVNADEGAVRMSDGNCVYLRGSDVVGGRERMMRGACLEFFYCRRARVALEARVIGRSRRDAGC
jgi:hypothetical protein